ncbi:hypothetical protein E4U57_005194 [Claviceps arundinis]|uniref:Small ribosomal subunit protein uS10m n=1 Tax=Claviceps arundinis TaxID=1623583 RepID=A0A9P7SMM6_9HYPO|nr:hypothetical protein E4U56_005700 [Claviceps arundinis]KAG5968664.1 hypothetical protein E4U57_005194 [Claviceps arundinis]
MRISPRSWPFGAIAADYGYRPMRTVTQSLLQTSSRSLSSQREQNQIVHLKSYSTASDSPGPPKERFVRLPRSLQAIHLKPLKRESKFGIKSCDLQLRSYSLQPLEFYTDFALRAAYYLGLSASGPVPLPRLIERWTVPRSHFIFKKAQENFERITLRRLIQIKDGHPDTVQLWLSYLRKHQYFGVGMKANVWEYGPRGVGEVAERATKEKQLKEASNFWSYVGQTKTSGTPSEVEEILGSRAFQDSIGMRTPLPKSGDGKSI